MYVYIISTFLAELAGYDGGTWSAWWGRVWNLGRFPRACRNPLDTPPDSFGEQTLECQSEMVLKFITRKSHFF